MNRLMRLLMCGLVSLAGLARPIQAGSGAWTSGGPYGGQVDQLAVDPLEPARIYAIASGRGLFRSTDAGATWSSSDPGALKVAVDPKDPAIVYVDRITGSPLGRSTDHGATWQPLTPPAPQESMRLQTVSGSEPTTLFVTAPRNSSPARLYASVDHGTTWQPLAIGEQVDLVHPTGPSVLFATYEAVFGETWIRRSTDGGVSWTQPWSNYDFYNPTGYVALAIPAGGGSLVYGASLRAVLRSTDGGATFQKVGPGLGSKVRQLLVDPTATSVLLAATELGIFRSTDSGVTWKDSWAGTGGRDARCLARDAVPSTYFAGLQLLGGAARSTDGGASWSQLVVDRSPLSTYAPWVSPSRPDQLFAVLQYFSDTNSYLPIWSTDRGATWQVMDALAREGPVSIAVAPGDADRVYAATVQGIRRSTDGGRTFAPGVRPLDEYRLLVVAHPTRAETLFNLGYGIEVSTDGGSTWSPFANLYAQSFLPDPLVEGRFYATIVQSGVSDLLRSTDGGLTWPSARQGIPPDVPIGEPQADPRVPGHLYVVAGGVLYETVDGASSWQARAPLESFSQVRVDPVRPGRLYATTRSSVLRSLDGGSTWTPFATGLPQLETQGLAIDGEGRSLHLGSSLAVFDLDLAAPPADFYTVSPCRALDTRSLIPLSGDVTVALTGVCGIPATATAVSANLTVVDPTAGGYLQAWPADEPAPGTSLLNFGAGQTRASQALLKLSEDGTGRVRVHPGLTGSVHLIVDVNGYFQAVPQPAP